MARRLATGVPPRPAGRAAVNGATPRPRLTLYVVHGSHPCAAVEKALSLKRLPYGIVEWPPILHAPLQKLVFGKRTVPGLSVGGEHVSGSRAIMRRLEQLEPDPPLLPLDGRARAKVELAERWGDEVFQPIARELIWAGFRQNPGAMISYGEHSRLRLPPSAIRLLAPLLAHAGARLNQTDAALARRRLEALPAHLDRIDDWIVEGVLGKVDRPNVADLQIGATLRLLLTVADARALLEDRPCSALALRLFPDIDGELPPFVGSAPEAGRQGRP
jgi:glutathione S-transferase